MAKSRVATDTIKGYFYQFNYTILQLLNLKNDTDTVCVEGIEDVDITSLGKTTAIQCKYYAKTEYNHSLIADPIRKMLTHYSENKDTGNVPIYCLYGGYASGQEKLPSTIDVSFLKEKLFTYTKTEKKKNEKKKYEHHVELGLDDDAIFDFCNRLSINVNAVSYEEQDEQIITTLKNQFSCSNSEVEWYYYNNALSLIKKLAIKQDISERTISKKDFLRKINNRNSLFDMWYLQLKGIEKYSKFIKSQYFSLLDINERFFLIDCDENISVLELKRLILKISEKWRKLSKRDPTSFCPYIYLHNIEEQTVLDIKKSLQNDNIYFWDGYDFKGTDFSVKSIVKQATFHNQVKIKFISEVAQIDEILSETTGRKQIYQFFINKHYYKNIQHDHFFIHVKETQNISLII